MVVEPMATGVAVTKAVALPVGILTEAGTVATDGALEFVKSEVEESTGPLMLMVNCLAVPTVVL